MHRDLLVSAELTVLLCILATIILHAIHRHRRRLATNAIELLNQLQPLSKAGIEAVAADMLDPTADKIDPRSDARLTCSMTWSLIGGIAGLRAMEKNAEILIELAFCLHQWNPELADVAEHLRLSGQDIRKELREIKNRMLWSTFNLALSSRVQRAVGMYYLMARRVIALAEINNSTLVPRLTSLLL
jgi:hypothetical protein